MTNLARKAKGELPETAIPPCLSAGAIRSHLALLGNGYSGVLWTDAGNQIEQRAGIVRMQADAAMACRAAQLLDRAGAVDGIAAAKED